MFTPEAASLEAETLAPPQAMPASRLTTRWRRQRPTVFSVGGLLALWWLTTTLGWIDPLFLPSPQAVAARLYRLAIDGFMDASLAQHLGASLSRVLLALLAALLTAIPTGMLIGLNRTARAALDPLIEFYRPIPPLAYLPLMVIWFGIGETSKVLLIYLAIFAPLVIATASGVRHLDPSRLQAAQSLGASRIQQLRFVILPGALPDILTGTRIALGAGWSTLVAAELIAATRGLGFMVQSAAQFLVTDVVIAGILLIALIALALELGLRYLQHRLTPWREHV